MRNALIAFLPILFLSLTSFAQELVKVDSVLDGDTFRLENGEKVRLIGIDAPETHHPRKPIEYFGKEATEFAKKMLEGKLVRLELDVQERDQYGRLLAYVFLKDSTFVNAELLKQGYAQVATYPPNVKYVDLFIEMQKEAREKKRCLWKKTGQIVQDSLE
jgi:micrococcal nuclease